MNPTQAARKALFPVFCIWAVVCVGAYLYAQSQTRLVEPVAGGAPVAYAPPLRLVGERAIYAADAFTRMAHDGTWLAAAGNLLHGAAAAVLVAAMFFITIAVGRRIARFLGMPAHRLNRAERFAIEISIGAAAFGIMFF